MRRLGDTERARRDLRVRARLERSPARPARVRARSRTGSATASGRAGRTGSAWRASPQARSRGASRASAVRVTPAVTAASVFPSPPASRRHPSASPGRGPNAPTPTHLDPRPLSPPRVPFVSPLPAAPSPPARRAFSARGASISARWLGLAGTRHLWIILRENNSLLKRNGGDVERRRRERRRAERASRPRGTPTKESFPPHRRHGRARASRRHTRVVGSNPRYNATTIRVQSKTARRRSNGATSCGSRERNTSPPRTVLAVSCPGKLPCGMLFRTNTPNAKASRILFLRLYCWWYHSADQNFASLSKTRW